MDYSAFTLVQVFGGILLLLVVMRYLWILMTGRWHKPVVWLEEEKAGRISRQVRNLERFYQDKTRFFNWWFQVRRIEADNVPGAFAELGVYKGNSARILHHMAPEKDFYLFDTFSGFPEKDLKVEVGDAATYSPVYFSDTEIRKVRKHIRGNDRLHFVPGHFPESAGSCHDIRFSLVNIDADLYLPTKSGLDFFYPRLNPGGVIILHDHNGKWQGVIQAVKEFSEGICEPVIHVPDREGTVMIIKNRIC